MDSKADIKKIVMFIPSGEKTDEVNKSSWDVEKFEWNGDELQVYIKENSEMKIEKVLKSDIQKKGVNDGI